MAADSKEIAELLKVVSRTINKYGLRNLLSKLSEIEEKGINSYSYEMLISIIREVCLYYNVTHDRLIANDKKSTRLSEESEARRMSYVLMKQYLNMSYENIARQFSRTKMVVSRAISSFETINTEVKADRIFYEKYQSICKKLDDINIKLRLKYTVREDEDL